jgi:hypothetical protein
MIDLNSIKKLLITLLALSLITLLMSCGSRKVQKSVVKENTTTEIATTEKKDIVIDNQTKTVINEDADEIEVKPIDTSKAIVVNGKTYKNAIVTIRKKKVNTVIENKEIVKDNSVKIVKVVTETKKDNKDIAVERKSNPFLPLLWLLIPLIGYLVWKYKYKFIGL